MSRKAKSKFNIPGIAPNRIAYACSSRGGGSSCMNNVFGLPPSVVTWENIVASSQRPFWEHQSAENYNIMTLIQDLSHPCWFVPCIFQYIRLKNSPTLAAPQPILGGSCTVRLGPCFLITALFVFYCFFFVISVKILFFLNFIFLIVIFF